jgi:hypothetical protein
VLELAPIGGARLSGIDGARARAHARGAGPAWAKWVGHTWILDFALLNHVAHINLKLGVGHLITKTFIEMSQGHISLSISPFLVIYANTLKSN